MSSLEERRRQVHERERPEGSAPTGRPGPLEMARCGSCGEFGLRRGLIGGRCTRCGSYGTFQSPAAKWLQEQKRAASERMWQAALGEQEDDDP